MKQLNSECIQRLQQIVLEGAQRSNKALASFIGDSLRLQDPQVTTLGSKQPLSQDLLQATESSPCQHLNAVSFQGGVSGLGLLCFPLKIVKENLGTSDSLELYEGEIDEQELVAEMSNLVTNVVCGHIANEIGITERTIYSSPFSYNRQEHAEQFFKIGYLALSLEIFAIKPQTTAGRFFVILSTEQESALYNKINQLNISQGA